MKKLKQRKGMVGFAALAAVLFWAGGNLVWSGITHVGPGVWRYGGDVPGTGGNVATEEFQAVIPENQYKRECYVGGSGLIFVGVLILADVIRTWKKRNELEKLWERAISNPANLREVHKHPEIYREDFKKWINDNHPSLKIWTLPPNSSN